METRRQSGIWLWRLFLIVSKGLLVSLKTLAIMVEEKIT
jgi:hypothetical protein